jgi:predicted transcriptional regulator
MIRLIGKIVQTKDEKTLKRLEDAFDGLTNSSLEELVLSEAQMASLERGIADREAGRLVSHEEFMKALDEGLAEGVKLSGR